MLLVATYLGFTALAALAPLVLRKWALRRAEQDPVSAWFGFAMRLQWVGYATLLAIPSAFFLRAEITAILPGWPQPVTAFVRYLICMAPAAALWVSGTFVAHDLSRRLRGVETPRRVTTELAILTGLSLLLPLPLFSAGVAAIGVWSWEVVLLLYLLPILVIVGVLVRMQKLQGMTLHAVTTGDLRDRVFALAAKAGVKLDQVFALPLAKWKHANAFATQNRRVMVTDYLLEHLDRDEVDAVMAHEIAHVAGKDPERQSMLLAVIVVAGMILAMAGVPSAVAYTIGFLASLVWLGYSRRCEYGADARALTYGVSPRAAITGLAKLNRLGHIPIDYPMLVELIMTHPSTRRRAMAVAKRAQLDAGEVTALLASTQSPIPGKVIPLMPPAAPNRYTAPVLEPQAKTFSTTFKHVTTSRITMIALLVGVATSLAVTNTARFLGASGFMRLAVWPAAIVFVATALILLLDWLACSGYRRVAKTVADRLTAPLPAGLKDGIAVGLAPHATPRIYEGFTVWDVGLVTLHGRLDYRGEETRFSLERHEVTEVSLEPGIPAWIRSKRVLVAWRRADGSSGAFALTPSMMARVSEQAGEAWKLYQRIRQWRHPEEDRVPELPIGPALGTPPTGEVTSQIPGADINGRSMISLAAIYLFITSIFGTLVRMPHGIGPTPGIVDAILIGTFAHILVMAPILRAKSRKEFPAPEKRKAA